MTQEDLATSLGQSYRWVVAHEAKAVFSQAPKMHPKLVLKAASVLGVSPETFRGEAQSEKPYVSTDADASRADPHGIGHAIKVRSHTPAGEAVEYFDGIYSDKYLPSSIVPHPEWGLGAMVVDGDSMLPHIRPGDIIIIAERLQDVRDDDLLVIGFTGGGHTLKRLRVIDGQTWELIPSNPEHRIEQVKRERVAWYAPVVARIDPMFRRRRPPWEL